MGREKVSERVVKVPVTKIPLLDRALLLGPPGVGKTEIVRAKAQEEAKMMGRVFVDLREASPEVIEAVIREPQKYYAFLRIVAPHVTPEDVGVPRVRNTSYVDFLPLKYFYILSLPGLAGLLFIDELNNVQRDDALTMFFSLLQEKEVAYNIKLSPQVKVIAAGNESEWSEVARALPWPLINRMTVFYVSAPSPQEWASYMEARYGEGWERLTAAYLQLHQDRLLKAPPPGAENVNFPTPRAWTEVALLLKQLPSEPDLVQAVCVGRLGPEVGFDFAAFIVDTVDEQSLRRALEDPAFFSGLSLGKKVRILNVVANNDALLEKATPLVQHLVLNERDMAVAFLLMMPRIKRLRYISANRGLLSPLLNSILPYLKGE
ncbi:MAG: AAA family ATPase [Thermofilaceae archaeon]